jgi:DNA topoisomerase III
LPIIPPHFDLQPIDRTASKLRVLTKLIRRKDVTSIINACDAGREGELIFRNLVKYVNVEKPIRRLWLQSMTQAAIRDGFAAQRDDAALRPLADAATCRSEADWLVGINGTRAMTAFNSKTGGFHLTTVGRVQTPTLAIVVEREERIKAFVPRGYFEVHGTFAAAAGAYPGRWFDEGLPARRMAIAELKPERIWDQQKAEGLRERCLGKPGHRHRGKQTQHTAFAAALRSDQPSAGGQQPFRFLRGIARCSWPRPFTNATRPSPIPEPTRARCPRIISEVPGRRSRR